jgi:hypothetical protein
MLTVPHGASLRVYLVTGALHITVADHEPHHSHAPPFAQPCGVQWGTLGGALRLEYQQQAAFIFSPGEAHGLVPGYPYLPFGERADFGLKCYCKVLFKHKLSLKFTPTKQRL